MSLYLAFQVINAHGDATIVSLLHGWKYLFQSFLTQNVCNGAHKRDIAGILRIIRNMELIALDVSMKVVSKKPN